MRKLLIWCTHCKQVLMFQLITISELGELCVWQSDTELVDLIPVGSVLEDKEMEEDSSEEEAGGGGGGVKRRKGLRFNSSILIYLIQRNFIILIYAIISG